MRVAHAVADREISESDDVARGSETVLVVDDDPDVRQIMSSVLSDLGYRVREAANGEAALDILKDYRPDLLVVDFGMPGTNGAEVAASARQRNNGLRILFVSGYSNTSAIENAVGKTALLHKPFRPAEFASAVAVLAGCAELRCCWTDRVSALIALANFFEMVPLADNRLTP